NVRQPSLEARCRGAYRLACHEDAEHNQQSGEERRPCFEKSVHRPSSPYMIGCVSWVLHTRDPWSIAHIRMPSLLLLGHVCHALGVQVLDQGFYGLTEGVEWMLSAVLFQ